jgi:hypothetical protein
MLTSPPPAVVKSPPPPPPSPPPPAGGCLIISSVPSPYYFGNGDWYPTGGYADTSGSVTGSIAMSLVAGQVTEVEFAAGKCFLFEKVTVDVC